MGRKRFSKNFHDLRGRWRDNRKLIEQILRDTASDSDWTVRIKNFLAEDSEAAASSKGWYKYPPDLRHIDLEKLDLDAIRIVGANLESATGYRATGAPIFDYCNLSRSRWQRADLRGAKFIDCDLGQASFSGADLRNVEFTNSRINYASFRRANIEGAIFNGADLRHVNLSDARCNGASFTNARVYGISTWGLVGDPADQSNLIITKDRDELITVDNLKVAQFIYLLLNNSEIRNVLETITSKVVLILGRFTPERKELLDAIRQEARRFNLVPVLFDFEKPRGHDTVETIRTLASLAKFVIADLTDAKSVMQELQAIVPILPSLPVQPLIKRDQQEPGMFDHIQRIGQNRVLPTVSYDSHDEMVKRLYELVIEPPLERSRELSLELIQLYGRSTS